MNGRPVEGEMRETELAVKAKIGMMLVKDGIEKDEGAIM